jgi:hypothetical protein
VHTLPRSRWSRKLFGATPTLALLAALIAAAAIVVSYLLWPTWPREQVAADAPPLPITVAGVLFNVPRASIRAPVLQTPGAYERIDLIFPGPPFALPQADGKTASRAADIPGSESDRLFVTIARLGVALPPAERLRAIYPRYLDGNVTAGPEGLALSPFRGGTPYEGEDLVYSASESAGFFARCTRPTPALPGTCLQERSLDGAEITLRFPRTWLKDWRSLAAGFDRLVASWHPQPQAR